MRLADVDARAAELIAILATMLPGFEPRDMLDDPRMQALFAPFVHLQAYRSLVPRWMHRHIGVWGGELIDRSNPNGRGAVWHH